jgi:hypothetical protein
MIASSMRRAVLAAAVAVLSLPAAAQVQGPVAPAGAWRKVLDTVRLEGEKGAADGFSTRSLTVGAGDPARDNAVYGIIVFYFAGADGELRVAGVELSLERSTLKTGVIRTDYWNMLVKPSGRVDTAVYRQRVDVPGDDVIEGAPAAVDLADPRVKARFDEMLEFWSAR